MSRFSRREVKQLGVGSGGYYRRPKTASPIVRAIFDELWRRSIEIRDFAGLTGQHPQRLTEHKNGRVEPGIMRVEEYAARLGYRLALIPIDAPHIDNTEDSRSRDIPSDHDMK